MIPSVKSPLSFTGLLRTNQRTTLFSMASKLPQFRGTLGAQQVADGMNAAYRNAKRLVDDARLLFDAGRFPSAASLAVLAIEEAGKASILRRLACAPDQDTARQAWREYRSHTAKNVQWLLPQFVAAGARRLDDFAGLFDESSHHPALLDQVKQIVQRATAQMIGDRPTMHRVLPFLG
jgi:AbiV family abortive infection protein